MATTLAQVRQRAGDAVSAPALDHLLCAALACDRVHLYAHPEQCLQAPVVAAIDGMLAQVADGVPLAYVLGTAQFAGVQVQVSPHVLVPRPETELLCALATAEIAERGGKARVLDLGTGSGAIAVVLAGAHHECALHAADISPPALAVARRNGRAYPHLEWHCFDATAPWGAQCPVMQMGMFDVVVCNPPYVETDWLRAHTQSLRHEPPLALDGGADGLRKISAMLPHIVAALAVGGTLVVEHGYRQRAGLSRLLQAAGLQVRACHNDLAAVPRAIVADKCS